MQNKLRSVYHRSFQQILNFSVLIGSLEVPQHGYKNKWTDGNCDLGKSWGTETVELAKREGQLRERQFGS